MGERRVFQSIVVELDGKDTAVKFKVHQDLSALTRQAVVDELVKSGLWTALRSRPYEKIPAVNAVPHSIFVNAMDTNPLAADQAIAIARQPAAFVDGISVISKLTEGTVFVCCDPKACLMLGQRRLKRFLVSTLRDWLGPISIILIRSVKVRRCGMYLRKT